MSTSERGSSPETAPRTAVMLAVLVGLCVLGLGLAVQFLREQQLRSAEHPQVDGSLVTGGLAARVEIRRDGRGVPHLAAESESDLWLGLGFVHAQDRLGQMLWLRRLARGRAAEWLGRDALGSDRFARTLAFGRLADTQLASLPDGTRRILEGYAAGVSERIERVRSGAVGMPSALRELDVAAESLEPWTAADSLAVFKLLCWGTGPSLDAGPVLDLLTQRLGGVGARPFEPKRDALQTLAVPFELPPLGGATSASAPSAVRADHLVPILFGGSAWVLSSRHTASGSPIVAADLHLAPTVPALVHQVHVEAPGVEWTGAAIPGVPVLWVGRSASVAWAVLPARAVTSVYYAETVRPRRPIPLYNDGFRWREIEQRSELIRVREAGGGLREEEWLVQATRHGPLIDQLVDGGHSPLALGWTGALDGDGLSSLLAIPSAPDAERLRASLESHHEPVVSVVFADTTGQGGYQVAGWLPRRILPTSLQPVPGQLRSYDLDSRIPFESLPAASLGERDAWLAVSDARLAGASGSGLDAEWLWRSGARAQRLERLLGLYLARGRVDLRDAAAVQSDVTSAQSSSVVRALVAVVGDPAELAPEEREMLAILRGWEGEFDSRRSAAAVHEVLTEELTRGLFAGSMGPRLFDRYRALPQTDLAIVTRGVLLAAARSERAGGWSDRARVRDASRLALRRTWARLAYRLGPNRERWSWGRLLDLQFASFVPAPIAALAPPAPIGGGPGTLAAADHDGSFRVRSASLYRMAVDLGVEDEMLVTLAPGQIEQPGHPNQRDGLGDWLASRPVVLRTSPQLVESSGERLLTLEPVSPMGPGS